MAKENAFFIVDVDSQPEIVQVVVPMGLVDEFKRKVAEFQRVDSAWVNSENPVEISEDEHFNFYKGIRIEYAEFDARFGSPSSE